MRLLIFLFLFVSCSKQNILYHKYSPTASSLNIIKWNTKNKNQKFILRETTDKKGRVIKLEFLEDGKIPESSLCYLASLVIFEYHRDKIFEKKYYDTGLKLNAIECESSWKTEYYLENGYISKIVNHFDMDSINYTKEELQMANKYLHSRKNIIVNDSVNHEIEYYYHSFAKENGNYPTNKSYKFIDGHYYYDDAPENIEIKNSINNKHW